MNSQLSLALTIRDDARFDNFLTVPGSIREQLLQALQQQIAIDSFFYLWGKRSVGVGHLMQASCHRVIAEGGSAMFLPLAELSGIDPEELLSGLESQALVCLYGLETVAGRADWEVAIFSLYNRIKDAGSRLIISSLGPPRQLNLILPDLKSRLSQCPVFRLPDYSDEEKISIVRYRGKNLGLEINDECIQYMLHRGDRDLATLMDYLKKLDAASLQAQRKITIPFIKMLFSW
jgi:DnaA-homolog protein